MKVLVAYDSKYGSTREIAERIGSAIEKAGLETQVLPAEKNLDIKGFDAVVIGSAVYVGQWRQRAAELLKEQETALASKAVWLFSSGPTGEGDPSELMSGFIFPESLKPVADRIKPRDIAFFHGNLDRSKLGFGERAMIKMIKAPRGDFREWESIRLWAGGIARALGRE